MESSGTRICQCHCVPNLSLGTIHVPQSSLKSWLKLALKRNLNPSMKKRLKRISNDWIQRFSSSDSNMDEISNLRSEIHAKPLAAGDRVRVRPEAEIEATLNMWNEYKGCMFMDAQRQYCGTIQRVFKPVERFVDERDYRVKKARGLVLMEGLTCEGTPDYGRCDRACFYFWREEWLEKIE